MGRVCYRSASGGLTMQGRISISRVVSNVTAPRVSIEILNDRGVKPIVRVEMTPEDFGNCLTGLGFTPCEIVKQ